MWWKLELWALGGKKIPPGRHTLFYSGVLWELSELVGPARAEPKSKEETVREEKVNAKKRAIFVRSSTSFWLSQSGPRSSLKKEEGKIGICGSKYKYWQLLGFFLCWPEMARSLQAFPSYPTGGFAQQYSAVWAALGKIEQGPIILWKFISSGSHKPWSWTPTNTKS